MEQVEEMCDFIVLINRGKNVLQGEVQSIKNEYKQNLFRVEADGALPEDVMTHFQVVSQLKNAVTIQLASENQSNELLHYLLGKGVRITRFEEILPTFDEIFIRRVGETGEA